MSQDACFLLPESWAPAADAPKISVRRTAAMGDAIASTVVVDRLIEAGYQVVFACHQNFHPILKLHPRLAGLKDQHFFADITLDGAYEQHPQRRTRTFAELFVDYANAQLGPRGIRIQGKNCTPRLTRPPEPPLFQAPIVGICPRANGYWKGRQVPNRIWEAAMPQIKGTCVWLGEDPAPKGCLDAHCRTIERLVHLVASLDLLVTVDTGPMHLAAAMGVPVLAIGQASSPALHLTDQQDWEMIEPAGLDCLNCQVNICPKNATTPPCQEVDPEQIAAAANRRLLCLDEERVAAVIPAFKPRLEMLERCVKAVLDQVDEIIVTCDAAGELRVSGIWPDKVRFVTTRLRRIGVGPNINHGVRYAHAPNVLLLNDDYYVGPGQVEGLKRYLKPGVGLVSCLSKYPDGTIYHAGKVRLTDGSIGHHHVDYRKFRPTIAEPCEVENTNLACALVRRQAFYQVGGFDERYQMYAEDDDLSMRLRQAGWKLWYTPLVWGVHDEHQETRNVPDARQIMAQSNALFGQLWGDFYRHNKGNPELGTFDYARTG